jgi:hypothetical protein
MAYQPRLFISIIVLAVVLLALGASYGAGQSAAVLPNPILFVTQVPFPYDTTTITNVFANHLPTTKSAPRGGDLCILYPDGSLKNLTFLAGYGKSGSQDTNGIAVREPSMHWSGMKALFSMVVGSPTSQNDSTPFYWQIYEIAGLGENESPVITKVPFQPAHYNNTNPIYATDDKIIFSTDLPHNGQGHLYPQHDEYRGEPSNTGLWKLDPSTGDLILLDHSPDGDFRPLIDSYGRVIFSRWDHLQRDGNADVDVIHGNRFGSFNYSDETAGATILQGDRTEFYPEPQSQRTDLLAGTNMIGFEFNHFIPWEINEDGTSGETMNHVGRHDLNQAFGKSFNDDPNLVNFSPSPTRTNQNSIFNMVQLAEDPTTPGRFYGVDCQENGEHGAGQIITLAGAPSLDAQDMFVTFITDRQTATPLPENGTPGPANTGHYRNPLPLSDGTLLSVHTTENKADKNLGTYSNPVSRYDFRIKTMQVRTGSILMANLAVTSGIGKSVSYWSDSGVVNFSGTLWELDPVEVKGRTAPTHRISHVGAPERAVMAEEGVDSTALTNYLTQHDMALIVSRNITNRNTDDHQQPFYLKVHNSPTQSPNPAGKVYDVAHLQLVEAQYLRGYGLVNGNTIPTPGRRVLAEPLNDTSVHNPSDPAGPVGSVRIGSDGSLAAMIPAHRAMSWQLVDSNAVPVVRERYWVTFQPGEIRTCASCHGSNGDAAVPKQIIPQNEPEALHTLLQYWRDTLVGIPPPPGSFQFSLSNSWNMISVPLTVPDGRTTVLFPSATSHAFAYAAGYVRRDTLAHGAGYWVKFGSGQVRNVPGTLITHDSVLVPAGWNMIGSIGNAIGVSSITSNPPALTTSPFFGYSGGIYVVADSIRPGQAYWVKVNAPGTLYLGTPGPVTGSSRIRIVSNGEAPPQAPGAAMAGPKQFTLLQNYPNPFNPATELRYTLPVDAHVRLTIFDVLGEEVRTLADGFQQSGYKSIRWDSRNNAGVEVPSGIYFYRLEARGTLRSSESFYEVRKMMLVR